MKNLVVLSMIFVSLVGCQEYKRVVKTNIVEVEVEKPVDHYFEAKKFRIRCESRSYNYNECELSKLPFDAQDVTIRVIKRHSSTLCHEDENFGFINEITIYVNDGCRATFEIGYIMEVFKSEEI